MTANKATTGFGSHVYGLGLMALGAVHLLWGHFDSGQPVPNNFPHRTALAYITAAFLLLAGLAILAVFKARLASILLTVMYASWTPLLHLPIVFSAPDVFFNRTKNALNLVLTGVAWIVADSLRARRA